MLQTKTNGSLSANWPNEFVGKVCLVTGGSSGIGLASAARFLREGAQVHICARDSARLSAVADEFRREGGNVHEHILDVSKHDAVDFMMKELADKCDTIDVLVNNAFSQVGGMVGDIELDRWHENFGATLHGAFYMTRAAIPLMRKAGQAAIINVSSVSGSVVTPGTCGYAAAKAGLQQLTRVVAVEEARYGIRANAIIVGAVDTSALRKTIPEGYDEFAKTIPAGRVGTPDEVASVIRFLASSQSSYVTAALLHVDGGLTAAMGHGISQAEFSHS